MKYAVMRLLLSTIGRLSRGVRIGYRHGFDSGVMLDYVYADKAHGLGPGRLIDRIFLSAIGWRAVRARRRLLQDVLIGIISRNRAAGRPTRILDVAAGPGRYLQDILVAAGGEDVRVLCRDLAAEGLHRGGDRAAGLGLHNIRYERGDAFDPAPCEAGLGGPPDVIVASGLYELVLDDSLIRSSMARLRSMLAPGGALIFTTQTDHPQLKFIANVLPNRNGDLWKMKCRPVRAVERWALEAGFDSVGSRREEVGLFTVTTARLDRAAGAPTAEVRDDQAEAVHG